MSQIHWWGRDKAAVWSILLVRMQRSLGRVSNGYRTVMDEIKNTAKPHHCYYGCSDDLHLTALIPTSQGLPTPPNCSATHLLPPSRSSLADQCRLLSGVDRICFVTSNSVPITLLSHKIFCISIDLHLS